MRGQLQAMLDSVLAMPAEAVIGGLFVALLLTLPIAGAYAVLRRGAKDAAMSLVGVSLAANLVGMVVASGYVWHSLRPRRSDNTTAPPGLQGRQFPPNRLHEDLARLILAEADVDRDGSISSGEASDFGARIVRASASAGGDSIDGAALKDALQTYIRRARESRFAPATEPIKANPGRPDADKGSTPVGPRIDEAGPRPSD